MAIVRKLSKYFTLFLLAIFTVKATSAVARNSKSEENKHKGHYSKSKLKIDRSNYWPFLPTPGSHFTASKGSSSYPFLILSPPAEEKENKQQLHDEKGSKYSVSRRQSVPMPYYGYQQQTAIVGYVPVYYAAPQHYNLYQPFYNGPEVLANAVAGQLVSGGPRYDYSASYSLQQNSFPFFKRSKAKKPSEQSQPKKRQFLPRHHWSFSQWPFDSHEYAFTKDPINSSNHPHLPRWGPIEWGGAGPRRHWAINREGLPSPFGIGLAPHMGGQGYVGLAGRWPAGHGYPLPTHFPTPPHLQHLLP